MTQDEIIEMAKEASLTITYIGDPIGLSYAQIAHFAKLVAAKERDRMCEQCNWGKHENAACNEANKSKILGES
jgi:hypothetical protein